MMYDRLKDLLVNEAQFGSRPGGDGSGEKKGKEAKRAGLINTMAKKAHAQMQNPKREKGSKRNIAKAIYGR
jgi:hypothetical protein